MTNITIPPDPRLSEFFGSVRRERQARAWTGYIAADGTIQDPTTGLDLPYIWVYFANDRASTRAIVTVAMDVTAIKVPVHLEENEAGEWEIKRVDGVNAPSALGGGIGAVTQPVLAPERNRQLAFFRNIVDGRVRVSEAGGLNVVIEPFDHAYGYFPKTTVLLVPTSSSGVKAAIILSVDISTNTVYQTIGGDLPATFQISDGLPAAKTQAAAVTTPLNRVRLAAAFLLNGATTVTVNDLLDIRSVIGAERYPVPLINGGTASDLSATGPGHVIQASNGAALTVRKDNLTATAAPTTGDDSGDGYAVGSRWYDLTNDKEYVALDVTLGAAVWKETTASGGSGGGLPAFGTGVIKTLSSDVAAAGSDRHLVIAAESGTTDNLIEISGLSVGDEVIIRPDSGDTITVVHNSGSATDKIILYNAANLALSGDQTLKLVKTASGKLVQYVDEKGSGGGGFGSGYIVLKDEQTANTNGGTFTSGAWQTRTLNTEAADTGGDCSLSSNQFTLAAGTYRISVRAPAYNCGFHKTRLRNITDGTTTIVGESSYCSTTRDMQTSSVIVGRFTIASSKTFEIQHRCSTTQSTTGFGVASNFGEVEVYTVVELEKE